MEEIGQIQPPEMFELDLDVMESPLLDSQRFIEEVYVEVVDVLLEQQRKLHVQRRIE